MASIPPFKRITKEDIPGSPSWLTVFLTPLNSFMEAVSYALGRQLTLRENISCIVKDLNFTTASTYVASNTFTPVSFAWNLKNQPLGLVKLYCYEKGGSNVILTNAVDIDWIYINGQITINFVTGLHDSKDYFLRVVVFTA